MFGIRREINIKEVGSVVVKQKFRGNDLSSWVALELDPLGDDEKVKFDELNWREKQELWSFTAGFWEWTDRLLTLGKWVEKYWRSCEWKKKVVERYRVWVLRVKKRTRWTAWGRNELGSSVRKAKRSLKERPSRSRNQRRIRVSWWRTEGESVWCCRWAGNSKRIEIRVKGM